MSIIKNKYNHIIYMWLKNQADYVCSCGSVLKNTCFSAIKIHEQTGKHTNIMNGTKPKRKKDVPCLKFTRKITIITWD